MQRCFLALRPDEATRERLQAVQERLAAWRLPARWVHPDDLHLTVCFLGDCDDDELRSLPWTLADCLTSLRLPRFSLPGLGAVGGGHRDEPKAVYAAVEDRSGALADLHGDCCDALGLAAEPAFLPHLTLMRPERGRPEAAAVGYRGGWPALLEAHGQALWGECCFTDAALLISQGPYSPGGPRYVAVERWLIEST